MRIVVILTTTTTTAIATAIATAIIAIIASNEAYMSNDIKETEISLKIEWYIRATTHFWSFIIDLLISEKMLQIGRNI